MYYEKSSLTILLLLSVRL